MTKHATDQSSEAPLPAKQIVADIDASGEDAWFPIVGIGASAGGLEAITQLLSHLPVDTGMAFVLVQHLAPSHASALAEILSRATKMPVAEVHDDVQVEPNRVYVIPPGRNMVIANGALQLLPRDAHGIHRPIDLFFRALAEDRQDMAIGVILSGTASDGTLGVEVIKAGGGTTFAQDATAQHEGMPQSAIASGCVDFVLSPEGIARELGRIAQHPHGGSQLVAPEAGDESDLAQVLQLLRDATGVDFTHYKQKTLHRRLTRRMVRANLGELREYVQHLRQAPDEVQALFQDILIDVTSFFRNPASFEILTSTVFPRLLEQRSRTDPVRIWTLGCSTGQEAYSLAIAFTEAAEAAGSSATLQLFATDLNPVNIEKARAGVYSLDIARDVSPERLRRFFTEVEGGYRIRKALREACLFSRHDVLADPPFSRIDLVTCRNLLIYLEPVLQRRILPTVHYALRPGGYLWLGGSETIGAYANLFDATDTKHKIFTKRPGSGPGRCDFPLEHDRTRRAPFLPTAARSIDAADLPREADRVLLSRFAPPGVLVSADLDILQYRGDTSSYLAPAAGKASLSLLKMLREGLIVGVRAAILRAGKTKGAVREEGLRVKREGGYYDATVEVIPLGGRGDDNSGGFLSGGFLVLFEAPASADGVAPSPLAPSPPATDLHYLRLEQELVDTRGYLQSLLEQQETANEELQSASEEVQSANEELQSTNEELETSKEEIQSSNEELATVNDELNTRNAELHRINADLQNLFSTVQLAVVMLGVDLRVRRFTPRAETLLNLIPSDVGRKLADIRLNLEGLPDLDPLLARVRDSAGAEEHEVQDKRGRWFALRLRPYRTLENEIDGVIVTLVDIDQMKRAHAYTESIVATVHEPLVVLDSDLRVRSASRAFYATFDASTETTVGQPIFQLGDQQWDIPELRRLLTAVLERGEEFSEFEVEHEFAALGRRTMLLNARRLVQVEAATPSILLAIEDITERKQLDAALRMSEVRFRRLFEAAKDGLLILDAKSHKITHVNPFLTSMLDYPAEHFLGRELWEIGFLSNRQSSESAMQRLREHGSIRFESLPLEGRDGGVHPVEMVASIYEEEHHAVIQCNIRDITERSHLEARLRGQASELSDLHRRKDEFLAMLSHELRNPLAPIANAVRLLGLEGAHETPIQAQARDIIERQMGQLQHLVDDLLDVSRVTSGRLQLRRAVLTIGDIVKHSVETARPLIEQRRHELTLSLPAEPIWLNADGARLEQVVSNLLTNAAKFTDEGGHIWLTVATEGDRCVLRVKDTGIGITPDLLPRIFDLFSQSQQTLDRSQGGLGIGLALVQRLTELHGGTVEVRSALGQGSEFTLRLPMAPADTPQLPPPDTTTEPATTRGLRIVVVDDNVDTVLSFSMLLKAKGHDVRTAFDGPTAVDVVLAHQPDVVLLDIGLPGLNGYEVASRLRREPSLAHSMLVALTGYGQESDRQKALQAGFHHRLVKPVDFRKLEEILASALAKGT